MDRPEGEPPMELLRHVEWLRRLAGRLVIDAALADDVAQQTLLLALRAPPADARRPRAWLGTVARHIAATIGRQRERNLRLETLAARDVREPSSHDVVAQAALHHALVGAVLVLDEPYRTALLRHWFDGEKPGAIARAQGVPVETVRTRLKRGLELLRRELVTRRRLPGGIVALVALLGTGARAATAKAIAAGAVATAAGGMGAGAFGGVIAMAAKAKSLTATFVVLAAVLVGWMVSRPWSSPIEDRPLAQLGARDGSAELPPSDASSDAAREALVGGGARSFADRLEVRGAVLTESGAPAVGARVGWLPSLPPSTLGGRFRSAADDFSLDEPTVRTDANGRFELPPPQRRAEASSRADVAAIAPGWLPALWRRAAPGDDLVLILPRGATVSGRVRDLEGRPIGGAALCWRHEGSRRQSATARSAADGTFRFEEVVVRWSSEPNEPGMSWLDVHAEGFAALTLPAHEVVREVDRHTLECDLWLMRGATARGRVVDLATGAPIAGADVWLEPWDDDVATKLRTTSARDGTFRLDGLPAWGVTLAGLKASDHRRRRLGELRAQAPQRGQAHVEVDLPDDGAMLEYTLALPQIGGVRGRVVDGSGRPVAGVDVYAVGTAGARRHQPGAAHGGGELPRTTDAEGRFELAGLALTEGDGTRAPLNGALFLGDWQVGRIETGMVVLIADAIVECPDLVLHHDRGVLVEIVEPNGTPVANAEVVFECRREGERRRMDGRTTDRSGRAVFSEREIEEWCGVPAPEEARLHVTAAGFAPRSSPFTADAGQSLRIVLEESEHRLLGRIVDRDGASGGGLVVALPVSAMAAEEFEATLRDDAFWRRSEALQSARVEVPIGVGWFALRGLAPGPWHVAVLRGWDKDGRGASVVRSGPHAEGVEAVLVVEGSAARASPGASAATPPSGSAEITITYAADGRAVFRAGYVSLRASGVIHEARPIAPGVFLAERVPAGAWLAVVDAPECARATAPVEVIADRRAAIRLSIDAGIVAQGRLPRGVLPALSAAHLFFQSDDGGGGANGAIAEDGSYSIPGLARGKHYRRTIHAIDAEQRPLIFIAVGPPLEAEAAARDDASEWLPAASLQTRFVEPKRLDPGATLRIVDSTGVVVFELSPVPRFGFERVLPLGRYTVELDNPGHARESIAVQLDPSLTEPVLLLRSE